MRTTTERASAQKTTGGTVELRFPYAPALVDDLKAQIPARFRSWDAEDRVWRVLGAYAPTAMTLLTAYFPHAALPDDVVPPPRIISRPKPAPAPISAPVVLPALPAKRAEASPALLTARFVCPTCAADLEQPVRVSVSTSERVAMMETPPAEFVAVCTGCRGLLIVGFAPAVAEIAA